MTRWTARDIPSQQGRLAIVTGTSGIGFETALALTGAGADVILAGRDPEKGRSVIERIRIAAPGAKVCFEALDLGRLDSVAAFGRRISSAHRRLDLLINCAEVAMPLDRQETENGFELQIGTNHLGHFALTAHLLPLLRQVCGARVVSLGSVAARYSAIRFDDLGAECGYDPMAAYGQSKLACLLFAFELQRRSWSGSWGITSVAAHPGLTRGAVARLGGTGRSLEWRILTRLPFLCQSVARGALPVLFAATSPDAHAGGYFGPGRLAELRGNPTAAHVPPLSDDAETAARLWKMSERLAAVSFAEAATGRLPPDSWGSDDTDAMDVRRLGSVLVGGLRLSGRQILSQSWAARMETASFRSRQPDC